MCNVLYYLVSVACASAAWAVRIERMSVIGLLDGAMLRILHIPNNKEDKKITNIMTGSLRPCDNNSNNVVVGSWFVQSA